MNCEVIRDLLPLYIDECCSAESAALVEQHIENCPECRRLYDYMQRHPAVQQETEPTITLHSVSAWKASLLQSAMLFVSFAIITLGVVLEGNTPSGSQNGLWAMLLIIPATGYLLSLAHWYFVRLYKSRNQFSTCSSIATAAMTAVGYIWSLFHYSDGIRLASPMVWGGLALTAIFCMLSKVLSNQYALLSGKE